MRTLLASAAAVALLAAPAFAQNNSNGSSNNPEHLTQQDDNFARQAAIINLSEIQAGHTAEQRGATAAMREYGRWLVTDHTLAQQLLELSVRYTDIHLPTAPDQQHAEMLHRLSGMHGRQFDQQFAKAMAQGHEQAVGAFQREEQDGHGRLKGYAMLLRPSLEQHLAEARTLESGTRGGAIARRQQAPGGGAGTASNPSVGAGGNAQSGQSSTQ